MREYQKIRSAVYVCFRGWGGMQRREGVSFVEKHLFRPLYQDFFFRILYSGHMLSQPRAQTSGIVVSLSSEANHLS